MPQTPQPPPPQSSNLLASQYAEEHRRFLQENQPKLLKKLSRSGDLESYLTEIGESAQEMLSDTMARHNNSPAVQNLPYQERVRSLQSLRQAMEEIIRH